ncbi:MAG: CPBP family intramembrane metalloprotease [Woeseiaceae bacterium]|nr:CPBP family intramembrane metalloprotease [Woeseiaceae bacterium]
MSSIDTADAKQYPLGHLLLLTFVPAMAVLIVKGLSRNLESLGGVAASSSYLFAEALILASIIIIVTRIEGPLSLRNAIPYQARRGAAVLIAALIVSTVWSIYFRDHFRWQALSELSAWIRAHLDFWPPEFLRRPNSGYPLPEAIPLAQKIGLYVTSLLAFGTASAMQTLYFRGFLLPRMDRLGWMAPIANSLLFVVFHLSSPWFWPQFFIFTLMWGVVTYATRNVWPAVISHVIFNTYGFAGAILREL